MNIELLKPEDWPLIAAIYQEGIDTGHATFEAHPPTTWDEWIKSKLPALCLGAWQQEMMLGWAVLSPVSSRCVYAGVAEVSVYVAEIARGMGAGSKLLQALIERSEAEGIWTLQAGIFPENEASVQAHAKHGFRLVGRREKLGKMGFGPLVGQWRDVLLLERRSTIAGIE
jgi:L-amino acid N-acyltransferase YncA